MDTFGPFQTKINLLPHKDKVGFGRGALEQTINFLFEMVQKGPDVPKRVPNDQKHLGWSFRTLLDPFGPLWNVDKPDMYGHVCFISAFFLGTPCIYSANPPSSIFDVCIWPPNTALVKPQPYEKFSDFYCRQWFGSSHAS